jgi:hypothetical protein
MAATSSTQAETLPVAVRLKCTDLRGIVPATALDVAVAGDRVALHCHTREGRTVIQLSLAEFLAKARGALDCNGRPFPAARNTKDEVLAADAAATARPIPVTPVVVDRLRAAPVSPVTLEIVPAPAPALALSPACEAQLRDAYRRYRSGKVKQNALADELGLSRVVVARAFQVFRREENAAALFASQLPPA